MAMQRLTCSACGETISEAEPEARYWRKGDGSCCLQCRLNEMDAMIEELVMRMALKDFRVEC